MDYGYIVEPLVFSFRGVGSFLWYQYPPLTVGIFWVALFLVHFFSPFPFWKLHGIKGKDRSPLDLQLCELIPAFTGLVTIGNIKITFHEYLEFVFATFNKVNK